MINDTSFMIQGYCGISDSTDTCCCEAVWNAFYEFEKDKDLSGDRIFVSYNNEQGKVTCRIGDRVNVTEAATAADIISECQWLCVKMNTTDDDIVNQQYHTILCDLLPSAKLNRKADMPTVEVFPHDMSENNFEWEIRIPIEKE